MTKKLIVGLGMSLSSVILPAVGNPEAVVAPHLWILVVIGVLAHVFQPAYRPIERDVPAEDRGTARQILWSCAAVQVAAVLEAVYWRYPTGMPWDWVTTAALVAMVGGLALRTWAVYTLQSYFTWHISVQPGQRVIRDGPYRMVRHPSYTGALLTYLGGPVFLHAWAAAALACIALPMAFRRRILLEEALLARELGPEYERYRHDVKALIPWVW